jgi:cytidylate kinase
MSVQIPPTKDTSPPAPRVVIVMGVSGCGKSTLGARLALQLRWEFEDAGWFHRSANVDKMHSGIPLTDEDRWPWLNAVAAWIDRSERKSHHRLDRAATARDRRANPVSAEHGRMRAAAKANISEIIHPWREDEPVRSRRCPPRCHPIR